MATCTNCGGDLPNGARFCPRCTAPVEPLFVEPVDEPARRSWRDLEPIAFAALVVVLVALLVVLVLVFGFGFLVEDDG